MEGIPVDFVICQRRFAITHDGVGQPVTKLLKKTQAMDIFNPKPYVPAMQQAAWLSIM
jgi:hypothetical protein